MDKFKKLGIIEPILESINEQGFTDPTEVQEKSIPFVVKGQDIIAGASTGSGKTLAFGTGIIQNAEQNSKIESLVLVPTRELADQVAKEIKKLSKYKKLKIIEVYGGVAIGPQIDALKKADIVVGTPGRILDHLRRSTLDLSNINTLVLDEADRMLDMGFIKDVTIIIEQCPKKRHTMLFSATLSADVLNLSDKYMKDAVEINCESKVDPSKLTQIYYDVPDNMKFSLFVHLIKKDHSGLVMVFCNTQRNTDLIARNLKKFGLKTLAIHGGYSQNKRSRALSDFHSNKIDVLVCTDVAARGLDIKGVSHVYNYDIPKETNQYIHRIGRTARAGKDGKAVSILASRDYDNFKALLSKEDVKIENTELPEFEKVFIDLRSSGSRDDRRGRFGGRDQRGRGGYDRGSRDRGGNRGGNSRFKKTKDRAWNNDSKKDWNDNDDGYSKPRSRFGSRDSKPRFNSRDSKPRFGSRGHKTNKDERDNRRNTRPDSRSKPRFGSRGPRDSRSDGRSKPRFNSRDSRSNDRPRSSKFRNSNQGSKPRFKKRYN
jgi:ATP-dependent RNA helicase DeaD